MFLKGRLVHMGSRGGVRHVALISAFYAAICAAQVPGTDRTFSQSNGKQLTIGTVVTSAVNNYPQIRVSQQELNAAVANITLARTAYLPRADALFQANRATRNNVFGALLPQSVIPPISGPVIGSNNGGSVWGSAAGILVSWQPFDFGLRHAELQSAHAGQSKADAAVRTSQLDVGAAAADAYLTVLASDQTIKAAEAAVQNWTTLLQTIRALTSAQLKPGADESRIEAELAMAKTQLVYARQAGEMSRATLVKFLTNPADKGLELDPGRLLTELPLGDSSPALDIQSHPSMQEQKAAVSEANSRLRAIERTWVPQFSVEGAASARGTGAQTNGNRLSGWNGLTPTVQNYAAGINIAFPLLDFASIHAREKAQGATVRAAEARLELVNRSINEQFEKSVATLKAAREVAENTPIEVRAARAAFDQAKARYQAGLSPIDDLAQAERLVVQAEVDDSIARLNVWRALLQLDSARGDIDRFLQRVNK